MNTLNFSRADSKGTGALEDEIEITPAMIRAGLDALALWDRGDSDEWKVWHVYHEMEKVRASGLSSLAEG